MFIHFNAFAKIWKYRDTGIRAVAFIDSRALRNTTAETNLANVTLRRATFTDPSRSVIDDNKEIYERSRSRDNHADIQSAGFAVN